MEWLFNILTVVFLLGGSFFALTGAVGILKMPDFYSRLHPAGKNDTLAQVLIMAGLFSHSFTTETLGFHAAIKLIIIVVALFFTAPTATHAITKAAHVDGMKPWRKAGQADA
jgi:multicomponent Na+:H+ antiporter subunit G